MMEHSNEEEFTSFMKTVVSQMIGSDHFELLNYVKGPLGNRAENVAGELERHQVKLRHNGEEKTLNFVIKMLIEEGMANLFLTMCRIFPREIQCYTKMLVDFSLFQTERGVPESQFLSIAPNVFAASESPHVFIALEDLTKQGYKMGNKFEMLNVNQVIITLQNLAKFHAIGFAMCKVRGLSGEDLFSELKETLVLAENTEFPGSPIIKCYDEIIGILETLPDLKPVAQKMKKYKGKTWDNLVELFGDKKSPFVSIIHGDLWTNNILFKYDENDTKESHPVGIKFVDFQLSRYCSVAIELGYFLYTSTTSEVRLSNMDKFLSVYYNSFVEMLNLLKIDVSPEITFESLQTEMKRGKLFALFYMPFAIPMQQVTLEDMQLYQKHVKENGPYYLKDDPFVDELLWRVERGICKKRTVEVLQELVNICIE